MLQFRPANSNEPVYCAERDIAWIFESLAGNVPEALRSENMTSWIANHIQEHHLTEAQLQNAAQSLLRGLDNFRDPAMEGAGPALQASGFWDQPEPARLAVLAALGLIAANFYCHAVRTAMVRPDMHRPKVLLATERTQEAIEAGRAVLDHDGASLDAVLQANERLRSGR